MSDMTQLAAARLRMILWYGFNPKGLELDALIQWNQEIRDELVRVMDELS